MRILVEILFRRLVRRMNGVEWHVQEKRLFAGVGSDETRGCLAQQLRAIPLVAVDFVVLVPVEAAVAHVGEIVDGPVVVAVLMIKSAAGRQIFRTKVAQVPLAHDRSRVSGVLKPLGERELFQRQTVRGPRPDDTDLQPVPHGVAAGQKGGSRGAAHGLDIEGVENRPTVRQPIQVRRLNLGPAHEPAVVPAKIIRQNENYVGTVRSRSWAGAGEQQDDERQPEAIPSDALRFAAGRKAGIEQRNHIQPSSRAQRASRLAGRDLAITLHSLPSRCNSHEYILRLERQYTIGVRSELLETVSRQNGARNATERVPYESTAGQASSSTRAALEGRRTPTIESTEPYRSPARASAGVTKPSRLRS